MRRTWMSARELTRVEVLSRVKAGTLSLGSAATLLAVSYRQAKRLAHRYRAEGAKGLKHRSAGGPSNHARPLALRERALALVRAKYGGSASHILASWCSSMAVSTDGTRRGPHAGA